MKKLERPDLIAASHRLGCDIHALEAVIEVETGGKGGFLADGRPRILFEAHVFGRLTAHRWTAAHPTLSSRKWNRALYAGGVLEHDRLRTAARLDVDCAIMACSWGLFQVMGEQGVALGFGPPQAFKAFMERDEAAHLEVFVAFVERAGLADELQRCDWAGFARRYNGPGYRTNRYDEKMAQAYDRRRRTAQPVEVA